MMLLSTAAAAQTSAGGQSPNCSVDPAAPGCDPNGTSTTDRSEVVVTGSRIARPELESATPVVSIGSEAIQRQGITNVQNILNQLPQIGIPGLSNTNSNFLTSGNGVATINLRNLGSSRTLVLVNGRRFVAGVAGTSVVDVNNIPADFVSNIQVVTGGASSIYGSDAIAGVVNFILKDNFEGVSARVQNGISQEGDTHTFSASVSAGTKFGGDRGAIMGNFTYDKDEGLFSNQRAISAQDCSNLGCGPQSYSSYPPQGRFQLYNNRAPTGNAGGYASNLFTFNGDNSLVSGFPTGYGVNREDFRRISTPVERFLGTVVGHYDLTDHVTAYIEGTYARTNSSSAIEPYALGSDLDLGYVGYSITNPFVPAAVQAQIAARNSDGIATNNVDQISFRRRQNDVFSRSNVNARDTFRIAGGFRGDIGGSWKYDVSGVYGQLKDHTETQDLDILKYANALDAVRDGTGNIVCRDATARAAGCVPINLFGYNTVSPAAAAYVQAAVPRTDDIKNTEFVATANVTGNLFTLPAGPVQVSVGGEYRREKSVENFDALTNAGLNTGNQLSDTVGKFNVKEAFGELQIPLMKDARFFNSLSLSGAARYSDYSTIGDVFSWNAGGEYSPFEGLRFRGNYAVANRAPNIGELYSPPSETFPSVQDPCNGVTATSGGQYAAACRANPAIAAAIARNGSLTYTLADTQNINGFSGGNTALREEKGKTITAGVVIVPNQIRGLSLTVDYFNIKVENAIGIVPRTTSIQQCLLTGLSQFCNNVVRNTGTGFINTVNAQNVNIATFKTSGIDLDLKYGRNINLFGNDRIDLHTLYTHTLNYKTQSDPSAPIDSGVGNLEYGEVFRDKVTATLDYSIGNFGMSWTTNFLSHMVDTERGEFVDTAASLGLSPEIISHNEIASRFYNNVQLHVDIGEKRNFELFGGVTNVFDRKPPKLEDAVFKGTITGTTTAADVYDPFGRRMYVGAQVRF